MGWSAFRATGNTIAIAVTTTASTPVQAPSFNGEPISTNYILTNSTSQSVFIGVGTDAVNLAVVPVPGTPTRGYWLGPNGQVSVSESPRTYWSVIAPATTSTVYITPGDGL
jgi:hypothetical protein